jgi:hypothetical protein
MNRIVQNGMRLTLVLIATGLTAVAQNQAPSAPQGSSDGSLGTYARQIRKDSGAPAKKKVFDNDNLPTDDKLSIVGSAPAAGSTAAEVKPEQAPGAEPAEGEAKGEAGAKPADDKKAANPSKAGDQGAKDAAWKQWGDRITAQKNQIDLTTRELDVLQREYQVRAAAMYADVGNRLRNSAEWDKQDAQYKQQIADKQKALDDAKQSLDDMQEEARKAGVPSSVREP